MRTLIPLLLVLLLLGCGSEPPPPVGAEPEATTTPLLLAIHPYDTPRLLVARFQPIADYLSDQLGQPVELLVTATYEEQIRGIVEGRFDLAYMGPTPYTRAHDRYQAGLPPEQRISLVVGEVACLSAILVRTDSEIETLDDLRGRTFAFGDHISFGSHYMPRAMLLRRGIDLADLMDYSFLERHERIPQAVLRGDYDAGGVRRRVAHEMLADHPELRILATSPELPPYALVARVGLDPLLIEEIRQALIAPDPLGAGAITLIGQNVRFRVVEDHDYDFARQVVEALERSCHCEALPW